MLVHLNDGQTITNCIPLSHVIGNLRIFIQIVTWKCEYIKDDSWKKQDFSIAYQTWNKPRPIYQCTDCKLLLESSKQQYQFREKSWMHTLENKYGHKLTIVHIEKVKKNGWDKTDEIQVR